MYSCIFVWLLYLNQFNSLLIKIYQSMNVSGLTTRYQVPLSFNTYSVPSYPYVHTHTQRKKLLYLVLSQTVAFITVNIVCLFFFAVCTISVRHCHVHCSLHILWVCGNKKKSYWILNLESHSLCAWNRMHTRSQPSSGDHSTAASISFKQREADNVHTLH